MTPAPKNSGIVPAPVPADGDHVGATIYLWSDDWQDRWLRESCAPLVRDLQQRGVLEGFWFDRFDARGPHLLVLLTPRNGRFEEVRKSLETAISGWLDEHQPAPPKLSPAQLEARHADCRGKTLCHADRLSGMASHGTFEVFPHSRWAYPFTRAAKSGQPFPWMPLAELSLWVIDSLADRKLAPVVRWMAAVDDALPRDSAGDFWCYQLHKLVPEVQMFESSQSLDASHVRRFVGPRNTLLLDKMWKPEESKAPAARALVDVGMNSVTEGPRWAFLRELVFVTLKQSGITIQRQAQLFAFALSTHLEDSSG